MVRVGTAGWSYPDWEGTVYPKGSASSRDALPLVAKLFGTLEINVTFYRPPGSRMARSWVERVSDLPSFRFTAKLWQGFTHRRDETHVAEEKAFKEGMQPLLESGRLGALLLQFPHSFKNTPANLAYLESLLERFAEFPRVVEVRHVSWVTEEVLSTLTRHGAGFCNVDQPGVGSASPPTSIVTGGIGYVRWHGRNKENWFRKDAGRDERYDYLYSHEEIREWLQRIRMMGDAEIFIIANNHYRGKAVANALELMHMLSGEPVAVPESLVKAYPHLAPMAAKLRTPGMLPL